MECKRLRKQKNATNEQMRGKIQGRSFFWPNGTARFATWPCVGCSRERREATHTHTQTHPHAPPTALAREGRSLLGLGSGPAPPGRLFGSPSVEAPASARASV